MKQQGVSESLIFIDKGVSVTSKVFKKLLQKARGDDVLVVYKLDRISRKYDDVKHVIRDLKNLGLSFEIGGLSNINTGNEFMNKALTDMLLILPGYVAENERAYIRERQSADIEIAKKEGRCKGKPKKYSSDSYDKFFQLLA
ncbi:recombinase family protein [Staphylococcus epidermidis]